jgi:phage baseplate assembly protein gpV
MRAGGPRPASGDMAMCGVYYALVTQNKDDRQLGRVKVRFPWLPGGDQDQSAWAQVAVPMAGGEFGTFTLPEIDDTVMVVFIAGDIRFPVVIGGMWNKTDEPPEVNENGKNDFRFIKSRAGHRLLFDDSSSTSVVLTDNGNANYLGCGTFAAGGDGPNKMEIDGPGGSKGVGVTSAGGTLNVWCPNGTLKVSCKDAEVTAGDGLDLKAAGDVTLEGGMSTTVDASGEMKVNGSKVKIGP